MSNLKVELAGLRFPNPFILASAPPTRIGEMIRRAFAAGWGGAVTKTISFHPAPNVHPRLRSLRLGPRNIGLENIELISTESVEWWQAEIAACKEAFPDRPLIASLAAPANRTEWQSLAQMVEETGADAVELNLSCPHGLPESAMGMAIGQDADLTGQVTSWVRGAVKVPVLVKLTPNVTDIASIAQNAYANGADAVTATNTVLGLISVDIESVSPEPSVGGKTTYGGLSGPAVKPVALRAVAQVAKAGKPVVATGGVSNWRDAVEFLLVGANLIQVCTAVMWRGFGIIDGLNTGLEEYLDRKGFKSVQDLVGRALPQIVDFAELDGNTRVVAAVDESCDGCGLCVAACRDGGFQAIGLSDGKAVIDIASCDGCGLCPDVCPKGSIRLVPSSSAQSH